MMTANETTVQELADLGEDMTEYEIDDPRFEDQGEEGDMSAGEEGELP